MLPPTPKYKIILNSNVITVLEEYPLYNFNPFNVIEICFMTYIPSWRMFYMPLKSRYSAILGGECDTNINYIKMFG